MTLQEVASAQRDSKIEADQHSIDRDYNLRAREVAVKEAELELKRNEQKLTTNPLALAIGAAAIAALANIVVAFHGGWAQRKLESAQAEHLRIVNAIAGDEQSARAKLRFLIATKLIEDGATRKAILSHIDNVELKNPPAITNPPPVQPSSVRVPVSSSWLDGGHNQAEICGLLMERVKTQYPGKNAKIVSSSEDSRKDFLGHVTYQYHCVFDVQ